MSLPQKLSRVVRGDLGLEDVQELLATDNPVERSWDALSAWPGGRTVFSKMISTLVPYSGTIKPYVAEVRTGFARVELEDRHRVRNHLNSVHAMALANLAELTSGLAVMYSLPDDVRGIVTGFEIEYEKKARGRLSAESDAVVPTVTEEQELEVPVTTRDTDGDVVTRATAHWLLTPAG